MNHSSDSNIATDTSRFATAGLILMIAALSTACTNEPARRSAVDPKRTCDPANPYSCLATRVTTGGGSPQQAAPSATNNGSNGAPTQTKVPPEELPPEELPPEELPGPSPVVDTSGERDVDAEKAKAIEKLTSAFEELGSAASTAIKNGGESKSDDSGDDSKLKPFLVTFSKDSFVGIATGSVTKNCAVTSGTVIEVKSEPAKITEFESQGVNQFLAIEVISVSPSEGITGCTISGQDFVYLGSHAEAKPKP